MTAVSTASQKLVLEAIMSYGKNKHGTNKHWIWCKQCDREDRISWIWEGKTKAEPYCRYCHAPWQEQKDGDSEESEDDDLDPSADDVGRSLASQVAKGGYAQAIETIKKLQEAQERAEARKEVVDPTKPMSTFDRKALLAKMCRIKNEAKQSRMCIIGLQDKLEDETAKHDQLVLELKHQLVTLLEAEEEEDQRKVEGQRVRNPDSNKLPIDIEKLTDPAVIEEARAYEKELVVHNTWRANRSAKLEALVAKATKDIKDNHKDGPPSKRAATGADKDEATGGACAAARMDTEDSQARH